MKILIISPSYNPVLGGTENFVHNLLFTLRRKGYESDLLTTNMDRRWSIHPFNEVLAGPLGAKIIRWGGFNPIEHIRLNPEIKIGNRGISSSIRFLLYSLMNLHFLPLAGLKKLYHSYDVLHFNDDVDLTFPMFGWDIRRKSIMHMHTLGITQVVYRLNPLTRIAFRSWFNYYIANSKFIFDCALRLGIPRQKIFIIPNGVDTTIFSPAKSPRKKNLILFVGRIDKRKGLHILLDALAYVLQPVVLNIIGEFGDQIYEYKLRAQIQKLKKTRAHIINILGPVSDRDLIAAYRKCAIFVLPSLMDSFPITILEAMSSGCFIIATKSGGLTSTLKDVNIGILVEPGNAQQIAQAINYALKNPDICIENGYRSRALAEKIYSWDSVVNQILEIYTSMLKY